MFLSWDLHIGWLVLGGGALVAMTVLPRLLHARPLSLPIIYVAFGFFTFELSDSLVGPRPHISSLDALFVEYITEFVVIVSLMGAGLRIELRPGLVRWHSTWRLLAVTMPLTVLATILLGGWLLGLAAAPAILLGGVIAPTDPVLADDVQIGPPGGSEPDEVRFTLTAEAGLNDGLAFPFIHLALAATTASVTTSLPGWLLYDVGYRVVVGIVAGLALGWAINRIARATGDFLGGQVRVGLFFLGATLLVYGLTEVVNGYGFLAVFVAALVRTKDDDGDDRREGYEFVDQVESTVVAFVLIGFGATLSQGVLHALTWRGAVLAFLIVLVIRPLTGLVGLIGRDLPGRERMSIAFFGIRGVGSLYYLAYAVNDGSFQTGEIESVWSVVALTIVVSIAVHGVTASPVLQRVAPHTHADDGCRSQPDQPSVHSTTTVDDDRSTS